MGITTSIEIDYKCVDGWHIFRAKEMPGLYVANRDLNSAYETVGPAIEKLMLLDSNLECRALPVVPFGQFVRGRATALAGAHQFTLLKEAA